MCEHLNRCKNCALFRLPGERSNLVASNLLFQFSGLQSSLQGATAAAGNVIVLQPTKTAMDAGSTYLPTI